MESKMFTVDENHNNGSDESVTLPPLKKESLNILKTFFADKNSFNKQK